jgi:hypothetical protein
MTVNNASNAAVTNPFLNQWVSGTCAAWGTAVRISDQTKTKVCPIFEDGTAL